MKKTLVSLAMLAALVACQKEALQENQPSDGNKQIITATVNTPTKLVYSEVTPGGGSGMTSTWQTGDKFYAIQDEEKVVTFTLVSGAGKTSAIFTAETEGVTASTTWKAVLGAAAEPKASEVHCGYMNQTGTAECLGNYNYVCASSAGETPSFDFANGTNLSYVLRVKLPEGVKCIEYTPCGYAKVTAMEETQILFNSKDQNDYSMTSTITLSSLSKAGDIIYIAIPPINYSRSEGSYAGGKQYGNLKSGVILTLMNDTSENADKSNGTVFESDVTGKAGIIGTVDLSAMTFIHREKPSDAIEISQSGTIECSLTGLTQKASTVTTYWSACNLGASHNYEVGDYYAWGESHTKETYTSDSYTLKHTLTDVLSSAFMVSDTKYGYTIAGSRYDVARVKWGQAWRMSHMIEAYAASKGNCTKETVNGRTGLWFSNKIFIPFAGYMHDKIYDTSFYASFWSADQLNRTSGNAGWDQAYAFANGKNVSDFGSWRQEFFYGCPIRPVLSNSVIE